MVQTVKTKSNLDTKEGFTLIEVMLVLGITGLILLGLLGGTFSTIARQRYDDALRGFAEYLSLNYSEALSPESLGEGNDRDRAILGKVLTFGQVYDDERDTRSVFSATITGDAKPNYSTATDYFQNLISLNGEETKFQIVCNTVNQYTPLWESELTSAAPTEGDYNGDELFKGTIIIARTPNSSTVHTSYAKDITLRLKDNCDKASSDLTAALKDQAKGGAASFKFTSVGFCLKSEDSAIIREVNIAEDGRNTSAVSILPEYESRCK